MKFIKNTINKIKDNPIISRVLMILGIFILIVLIIILFASCSKKQRVYTYEELETKMVELAKKRYSTDKNKSKLPKNDKDSIEVSLQSFVDDKSFKDIESLTKKHSACTGNVKIINNYGNYLYLPYLDCGKDYKSKTIYDVLTSEENVVNSGNGLYEVDGEYIFKGDNVNNYLKLNDNLYRILKINEDGTIRIIDTNSIGTAIWDDRYNLDTNSFVGINDYIYNNINSRLKDSVESIYENNISANTKQYFVSSPVCVGRRSTSDDIHSDDVECSSELEPYPITLLNISDFYNATLDRNCISYDDKSCLNYNYMRFIDLAWTITANKNNSYSAFAVDDTGAELLKTTSRSNIYIVATLNKGLLLEKSGDGTIDNPFQIKSFSK